MVRSRLLPIAGALLLILLAAGLAVAQSEVLAGKVRTGDTVTIAPGETVAGDLYAFAGTVRVNGTVEGDLVATGGQVDVSGTVTGDILAAGGQVTVSGTVDGDVRMAGGTATISGTVTEDALIAGGTFSVQSSGQVGGDVIASAGQLAIDGTVTGNVVASAGTYTRTGQIGGVEDVTLTDRGDRGAIVPTTTDRVIDAVRHFLVVVLVGALMLWLVPRAYASLRTFVRERPLPAVGWGLIGLIGFIALVIVVIILCILVAVILGALGFGGLVVIDLLAGTLTVGGLSLGLTVVAAYVADVIVAAAIASLIPQDERSGRWQELALLAAGAAVIVFLTSLPIVGPWAKLVVVALGLGALLATFFGTRRRGGAAATTTPPPQAAAPAG